MPHSCTKKKTGQQSKKNRLSKRMKENICVMAALHKAPSHIRKIGIDNASPELIKAFTEIARNLAAGNVRVSPHSQMALRRHGKKLDQMISGKTSIIRKKRLLQEGGFLGALVKPLMGVIGPLVKPLVGSLVKPLASSLFSEL